MIAMILHMLCLAPLVAPLYHGFKLCSDLLSRWKGENDPLELHCPIQQPLISCDNLSEMK